MTSRRNRFAQLLMLATTASFLGCSTTRPFTVATGRTPDSAHRKIAASNLKSETASHLDNETASETTSHPVALVSAEIDEVAASNLTPITIDSDNRAEANATSVTSGPMLATAQSGMTLADFEAIALSNNPTLQELVATTQKAAGFRIQVGLRANPYLFYNGTQIADAGTDQHTVNISQTYVTGDKLALNRRVLNEALRAQLLQLEAQKYRVATDIRVTFYDALAAQKRIKLIKDFQSVADKGLELAELRKKALEGSQLDVVQAKVQKNEIDLALQQAQVSFDSAWRALVALAGNPQMLPVTLQGELPQSETSLDWALLAATMIGSSPEYQAAQTRVSQARANLDRQCVQPIPNLDFQLGAGTDNGTNAGLINLQVGAPIPVFNKNQGNIAAARAELLRASKEVERIENSIKARLAAVSRDYDSSLAAVTKYASDILPNANEGLKLAETAYKAGETSFVQVLVARRTYYDTNLQFIVSQAQLAQARAQVDGYVLTGALDSVIDGSGDDGLRGLTFSQQ